MINFDQVNLSINEINKTTQNNSALAESIADSSNSISFQSAELNRQISYFSTQSESMKQSSISKKMDDTNKLSSFNQSHAA